MSELARRAGRGGVAVLGAKVYFILAGLVQQALLPRVLGLAGYGALARVLAVANVVNNVVVAGSVQGVSRAVAGARGDDAPVLRRALALHAPLAAGAALVFAAAAPVVARLELAPHIAWPLVAASAVVLLYGLYAPLVGALNGRGQFGRQASLDVTFATLRTAGLLGGAWLLARGGLGVLGAVLGFAAAALAIVPVALRWSGTGASGGGLAARPYLSGLWPLVAAQLATNLVMQSDISLLGRFLSSSALAALPTAEAAQKGADEWVGVYRACQLFAFLPYQLLMGVTQVLFPMLARAKADGDAAAVRAYVGRGVRLAAIAGGAVVAVIACVPGALLRFAYGVEVAERGAATLRVLAVAQGFFALMGVGATVLASLGHERRAAQVTWAALAASAAGIVTLVPGAAFGAAQLRLTAACVTGAMALALVFAALSVRGVAGAFLGAGTVVRVGGAVGALALAGTAVPAVSRPLAPLVAIAAASAYAVVLAVTREVTRADVESFAALLRGRA